MIKTKAAKFAAGFVGFALALSLVVTPVTSSAQTTAELTAMINSLLAQIAQLQAQVGGSTSGSMMSHTFTADLTIGSTGADVTALQQFLVSKGFLTMPAGVAMGYFGSLTQSALAAFQVSQGISPASGYFGPITRASVNQMVAVMTPGTPGTPSTPGSTAGLSGGAGDITVNERSSGVEDEILEGDEEVKVLGFEVEPQGSDVAITSVRVEFEHDGSGSDRMNRYIDEVQIFMNNTVVGTADARDFSENSDVYSRNIPVSGATVREDQKVRFYVGVTALNNIDSDDLGEDWEVALGQIRFNDATGAILTDSTGTGVNGSITETFSFEDLASSGDIELSVREDDDDINDAHTVQVDESSDTNDVEILSFTLEADGSDIYLNSMVFDITASGAGVTEIANDFRLMMDGEEVGEVSIDAPDSGATGFASNTDTTRAITFSDLDDDDVIIDEGDEVSFVLMADINDIDGAFTNGDSLSVSLDSGDIDADDENGDTVTDLTGTAESNDIAFSASGIMLSVGDSDPAATIDNNGTADVASDDRGVFVINFDVTAFDETAYIALTGASSTSATPSSAGAYAYVENVNANDTALGTGTTTVNLTRVSGGTVSGNYLRLNPGTTAKMRLTVYHDAASASVSTRAQLHAINFATSETAGTSQQLAVPTSDYQSQEIIIPN